MGTVFSVLIALVAAYLIFRAGMAMLRALATPLPEPPPPGELRKVKIGYRCPVCGTEVRMTVSTHEEPDPPRHCAGEMDLIAPVE